MVARIKKREDEKTLNQEFDKSRFDYSWTDPKHETGGSFARYYHTACVAFQLIPATKLELAAGRHEPARDTLPVRHGVPQVLHGRRVDPGKSDRTSRLPTALRR